MANSVNVQVINDGGRNWKAMIVVRVDNGDIVAPITIADVSEMTPPVPRLKIKCIEHDVKDALTVNLAWGATVPFVFAALSRDGKFSPLGLENRLDQGDGATGDIVLTTSGWQVGQVLTATILLHATKAFTPFPVA